MCLGVDSLVVLFLVGVWLAFIADSHCLRTSDMRVGSGVPAAAARSLWYHSSFSLHVLANRYRMGTSQFLLTPSKLSDVEGVTEGDFSGLSVEG